MTHYKIIVNPVSGRGNGEQAISQIEQYLNSHHLQFDIVRTERPWHAAELAQQAAQEGYDVVVAAGGDGTVNEVINGLMLAKQDGYAQSALGVLCVGRGNDFAFGAGVPTSLPEACLSLAQNHRSVLDIGRAIGGDYPQGRYFGNGVGIGFDTVVGFESLKMKRLTGFASYLVAALKTIFLYSDPYVHIQFDSQSLDLHAALISIMNGRRMGGGFMMAPRAHNDDSLFDLCIVSKLSRPSILALIPRFMKGTQFTHPAVRAAQTRQLTITALEGVLPAHADGETLCVAGKQLTLEILPHQLEIVCPVAEKSV